ncbi:hypothetical protein H2203_005306 [Taxawa tesnikishii (nom. ined.)]|nr:hypothetical protein H2203_005306 [Dothideales sp. JES 119]
MKVIIIFGALASMAFALPLLKEAGMKREADISVNVDALDNGRNMDAGIDVDLPNLDITVDGMSN